MKEPEKVGNNELMKGIVSWTPESFSQRMELGPPVQARVIKVKCPYCALGTADLIVEGPDVIGPGDVQKADVTPKQCDKCRHLFRIGYITQWVGIRMEGK